MHHNLVILNDLAIDLITNKLRLNNFRETLVNHCKSAFLGLTGQNED